MKENLVFLEGFSFIFKKNHLFYECKVNSFIFNNKKILKWESTGIFNRSDYYSMNGIENTKKEMPILKNDERLYVYLQDNHFQQNNVLTSSNDHVINKNVVNIYIIYKLDPLASTRDKSFTIQNALFGAMKINDTTIYAENNFYRNFTDFGKKFVLSLHYNDDNSYLFVNGRQELKFKAKTDQILKEKLCIGNLSDQWTTSESEKPGVYGKIYDFVMDYEQISGVKAIYDMHRYLITKHNINP